MAHPSNYRKRSKISKMERISAGRDGFTVFFLMRFENDTNFFKKKSSSDSVGLTVLSRNEVQSRNQMEEMRKSEPVRLELCEIQSL